MLPFDGPWILVVGTDVAHQFSIEVLHGREDAAADHIALDAREPVLHLIQPRRVGGCEMDAHAGVCGQEIGDPPGLVALGRSCSRRCNLSYGARGTRPCS